MFYSQAIVAGQLAGGNAIAHPAYTAVEMVGSNGFPAAGAYAEGTVWCCTRVQVQR